MKNRSKRKLKKNVDELQVQAKFWIVLNRHIWIVLHNKKTLKEDWRQSIRNVMNYNSKWRRRRPLPKICRIRFNIMNVLCAIAFRMMKRVMPYELLERNEWQSSLIYMTLKWEVWFELISRKIVYIQAFYQTQRVLQLDMEKEISNRRKNVL